MNTQKLIKRIDKLKYEFVEALLENTLTEEERAEVLSLLY